MRWSRSSEKNAEDGQRFTVPLRQSPFLGWLIHPLGQAFRTSFLVGLSPHPTSFPHKAMADMETNTLQVHPSLGWSLEEFVLWDKCREARLSVVHIL